MAKRASGPPRRPRNPVAKAVRTPRFRMQVVEDKREREKRRLARLERALHQKGEKEED
ncbi:DUF7230 family protein [Parasulfuritortus cantonensis]|uniref:DUF7230 family protein n=1 Tax=Parasulfuritortus cantonensis TaxID=2528202 RepID=UPI0014048273|nr:hypothetical protein [Parasulfuritortus cantonensis]